MTDKANNSIETQLALKLGELKTLAKQLKDSDKKEVALAKLDELETNHQLQAFDPGINQDTALDCLTPAQLEDKQLVGIIKSIGRPPPFNGRGTFTAFHKAWVCSFLYSLPSPQFVASIIGCGVKTFYYHQSIDELFKEEWKLAMDHGMQTIVGAAAEVALGVGDPDVLSRRSEKLLGAFLLRESRVKVDVDVEHKGGVIVIPQPLSADEFEKVVFQQQERHRNNCPDPLGDARRNRAKPVIIDHDPHDTGPTPPAQNEGPTSPRQAQGGVVTLQSPEERDSAIAQGQTNDLIDEHRTPDRIVRSY